MGIFRAYKKSGGCKPEHKCTECRYYQPVYRDGKKLIAHDCKKHGGDGWWTEHMACRDFKKPVKYREEKSGQMRLVV